MKNRMANNTQLDTLLYNKNYQPSNFFGDPNESLKVDPLNKILLPKRYLMQRTKSSSSIKSARNKDN